MNDIEVPAPRTPDQTALPAWIHNVEWTTSEACVVVAAIRGISEESARRWLGRHCDPVGRQAGREGENLWTANVVRWRALPAEVTAE